MYGAILGDIIGSPYEFDFRNIKTKDFPLFSQGSTFTDDTVMTIAVADGVLKSLDENNAFDEKELRENIIDSLKLWGERFPYAGYGTRFSAWLFSENTEPYNSYGNGSAMRVSSVGWLFDDIETTRKVARISAEVTHNHPEGLKGAEATAAAIFMARNWFSKDEIKEYIVKEFGYDLTRTCDEIRPTYRHIESCQETVPEAITAFLEGDSFEDVIRTAVSLGGDSDTLTCIAGGIAEAYYGVTSEIMMDLTGRLPESFVNVLNRFGNVRPVNRHDWAALPLPENRSTFVLERAFSAEDIEALRKGHIPEAMEDKWFWYVSDGKLYAHRSWTGICIYCVDLMGENNKYQVQVNRDPEQYGCTSDETDMEDLNMLLDYWTQPTYDYYNEWLGETVNTLKRAGQIPSDNEE